MFTSLGSSAYVAVKGGGVGGDRLFRINKNLEDWSETGSSSSSSGGGGGGSGGGGGRGLGLCNWYLRLKLLLSLFSNRLRPSPHRWMTWVWVCVCVCVSVGWRHGNADLTDNCGRHSRLCPSGKSKGKSKGVKQRVVDDWTVTPVHVTVFTVLVHKITQSVYYHRQPG